MTQIAVRSLGRPPSPKPALEITAGVATGRVVIGGGEYGPYRFVVDRLSAGDWAGIQRVACTDLARYDVGAVTAVADPGPATVGGEIAVTIRSNNVSTNLSFDPGAADSDPLIASLRSLAVRYFAAATF